MLNIDDIKQDIINSIKLNFDLSLDIKFFPSLNLELGDFYSDFCILLAKQFKKSTQDIYQIILKDLSCKNYEISLVADYVNIKLKSFKITNNEIYKPHTNIDDVIIFIPVLDTYPKSLFYRLAFKGFLTKLLFEKLNIKARLFLGNENFGANKNLSEIKDFSHSLENIYNECKDDKDIIKIINTINASYKTDLFITYLGPNTFYQRELSKEFFKTEFGQKHYVFKFHTKDWGNVYKEDEHEIEDFIKNSDLSGLVSLMYMLSKELDFKEINYYDAKLESEENFIYFLNLTVNRLNKFFDDKKCTENDQEFILEDKNRDIMMQSYLFYVSLYESLLIGNIGAWLKSIDDFLMKINVLLNNPNFRASLKTNAVSDKDIYIFNFVLELFQDFAK